jgi:hypothetical protein
MRRNKAQKEAFKKEQEEAKQYLRDLFERNNHQFVYHALVHCRQGHSGIIRRYRFFIPIKYQLAPWVASGIIESVDIEEITHKVYTVLDWYRWINGAIGGLHATADEIIGELSFALYRQEGKGNGRSRELISRTLI